MHINHSLEYPAPLEKILEMVIDPAYSRLRLEKMQVHDPQISLSSVDQNTEIHIQAMLDPSTFPSKARKFVKGAVSIEILDRWSILDGSASRSHTLISAKGIPVTVNLASTLTGKGEITIRKFDGDLSVKIPLIGKAIESQVASRISRIFDYELLAAREWLSSSAK